MRTNQERGPTLDGVVASCGSVRLIPPVASVAGRRPASAGLRALPADRAVVEVKPVNIDSQYRQCSAADLLPSQTYFSDCTWPSERQRSVLVALIRVRRLGPAALACPRKLQ